MNDSDRFFRASASDASRPRAVNPQTGVEQSWQRASNYAAPLDNPHGLITWQLRELVKGLSLRPDLARMLLTGAAIEDNAKADEIIASAHAVAATDAKANEGTAVHAALTRSFLGHEVPQEYLPHVRAFAAELQRNGLTPVATEIRTLCVKLGVIGHTDWVVKTADGRYLILDVKTGKLSDARKFAVQCIAYGAAEYIDDGNNGWSPIPFMIDQTEAILAHIDPETGATSLYRVDLVLGLYGATLAERVRDWAKIDVLSPYTPVHHAVPTTGALHPERVQNRGTVDAAAIGIGQRVDPRQPGSEVVAPQYAAAHPDLYDPNGVPVPAVPAEPVNQVVGQIEVTEPRPASAQQALEPPTIVGSVDAEKAALMRLDKAALQGKAKHEHGATDLAHNREWLACYIIARRHGCDESAAVAYAKAKGAAPLPGETPAAKASPEQPAADLSFIFKSIEGARSEGAIEALRLNVVERRGDQAWTDEMAEAARVKVTELLAASGNAVSSTLARIQRATEPAHIAALWSEVTIGGSAPGNWSPDLKAAADRRLHEIQTAQGAPPANPYGPQ
jgi:hypothetical protein